MAEKIYVVVCNDGDITEVVGARRDEKEAYLLKDRAIQAWQEDHRGQYNEEKPVYGFSVEETFLE